MNDSHFNLFFYTSYCLINFTLSYPQVLWTKLRIQCLSPHPTENHEMRKHVACVYSSSSTLGKSLRQEEEQQLLIKWEGGRENGAYHGYLH